MQGEVVNFTTIMAAMEVSMKLDTKFIKFFGLVAIANELDSHGFAIFDFTLINDDSQECDFIIV